MHRPKTKPPRSRKTRGVDSIKAFKDMRLMFERNPNSVIECRANDPSTSRTLQATEQIQNQNDYENGSDYAVRPVAESITACRESPD